MTIRVPSSAPKPLLYGLGGTLWLICSSSHAACLIKPRTVQAVGTIYTFMIAARDEVAAYVALGFSAVPCPADLSSYRAYVDRLCASAPSPGMPVIDTVALIGRPRDQVCASARAGLL